MDYEISSHGVVLQRRTVGEADRLVVLFTRDEGKLLVRARGAARGKSKLGPLLEPLCELDVRLVRRRTGQETLTLTGASLLHDHSRLKANLPRTAFAMLLVETVEACYPPQAPHPEVYDLIKEALLRLERTRNLWGWALACQLRMLAAVGLFPRLSACTLCETTLLPDPVVLSAEHGGLICEQCGRGQTFEVALPQRILKILAETSEEDELDLTPEEGRTVETFLRHYLEYHLDWNFKSLDFIASLRR